MKKMISLSTLASVTRQCARRFPITVGFIAMLTIHWVLTVWAEERLFSARTGQTVSYYLLVGSLLTAVLQLWNEEVESRRTRIAVNIMAHIILLADSAYLYSIHGDTSMEVFLAHASVIMALGLCLFLLPFFREKDDTASWNFTHRLLINGITSWLIGGIMCGGICLLTASIEQLFNISLSFKWYITWFILFMQTLPMLLFIGRIPAGAEKHDRLPRTAKFLRNIIRYLFLPLLGCYLIVLYGYLGKIIIEWQLPDGWVSMLVSVLTFGSIGIVILLYPALRQGAFKTEERIVRFLPLAVLPLLILMTVAIARRFSDYGVTVNRLYLLTLNIWFYVVCAGITLSRARRVWWIAASFALFFILTSALPLNITRFSRNRIYAQVETVIKEKYKGKLPMSEETYINWLSTLPVDEALRVNGQLEYLDNTLDDKSINALASDSISWWNMENSINTAKKSEEELYKYYSSNGNINGQEIMLNEGYSSMIIYNGVSETLPRGKTLFVPIKKGEQPIDTLEISISDIRKWDALSRFTPRAVKCRRKGNRFILTSFSLNNSKNPQFTYSGYYLVK